MTKKNPFVFCLLDGNVIANAGTFTDFKKAIKEIPLESVIFHANRGDFANWLVYLGKKDIAADVREVKGSTGRVRAKLLTVLSPSVAKKILKTVKRTAARKAKKAIKKKSSKKKTSKKR